MDAPPADPVRGVVTARSVPTRRLPPAEFTLCDPTCELPLLVLTVDGSARDAGNAGGDGGDAQQRRPMRAKVWLWGLWCDRLADVKRGDTIAVYGAEIHEDDGAHAAGARWTLVLPPRGAAADAAVIASSGKTVIEARAAALARYPASIADRRCPPPYPLTLTYSHICSSCRCVSRAWCPAMRPLPPPPLARSARRRRTRTRKWRTCRRSAASSRRSASAYTFQHTRAADPPVMTLNSCMCARGVGERVGRRCRVSAAARHAREGPQIGAVPRRRELQRRRSTLGKLLQSASEGALRTYFIVSAQR